LIQWERNTAGKKEILPGDPDQANVTFRKEKEREKTRRFAGLAGPLYIAGRKILYNADCHVELDH